MVKCSPQLKSKLLAKKKNLAGQVGIQGFKYFIAQYLPEPFKAAQNKHRKEVSHILEKNSKKKPEDCTPVRVIGPDLQINNKVVTSYIHPPSPGEVCKNKAEYGPELNSFDLLEMRPIHKEGSTFQGFVVHASKLLGVSLAYTKTRIAFPSARHIMCAYNVAGMKDSFYDGEDHTGMLLAKKLKASGLTNVAIFIARETGPDKLGPKHFEIIRDLVGKLLQILANSTVTAPIDARWFPKRAPPPIPA